MIDQVDQMEENKRKLGEAAFFGEKGFHDLVEELLSKLFSYDPQTVINWVNKMRREGWALGSGPLGKIDVRSED